MSIDLSNVIALALGSDDVLQIQDAVGTVLWQKTIYYNVNISAGSNGTVSVNGVSGNYSQSVPSGTVLTIEGTGNTGYNFNEWSDGNTDNPRTVTVNSDITLTAAFEAAVLPNYFYVEDISGSDNTLSIKKQGSFAPDIEVFCSSDQKNWTSMGTTSTTAITATVPANGKLYLRATANKWGASSYQYNYISASGNHNVGGNIMSLLYNEDFENQTSFPAGSTYTFFYLFKSDPNLINAENLVLPATTLTNYCYGNMFYGCTSLTQAPALPAQSVPQSAYSSMFQNCTSLATAPTLPATTLAPYCYQSMFNGCASLTQAPELPATTLATSCYNSMFKGCTALTTAPVLPATTLAPNCYSSMFNGCTSLTQAPALPAQSVPQSAYSSMFQICTSLATAPALPATTLANYCYQSMFNGCTALTTAPELPATTLKIRCYMGMFGNCTALATAPELPATTLDTQCYDYMFRGCTSLTTAPVLPATTLVTSCYAEMFIRCSNLNSVTTYAQDISASNCIDSWLDNVAATGDFYNMGTATYTTDSPSGIPTGWVEHRNSANEYFYLEDISGAANTVTFKKNVGDAPNVSISVSTDKVNWTNIGVPYTQGITATIPANGKLYVKATTERWGSSYYNYMTASGNHNIGGNIMSLLYGDNFQGQTTVFTHSFTHLFYTDTNLVNAEDLVLPAATMADYCYESMFQNCTSLVTAPTLSATTLTRSCYSQMFYGCTALTQAPALPATTLADGCYYEMFNGCTSLTSTPALPATTLTVCCYQNMFQGCSNLNSVTTYAQDISANNCLLNWLRNVAATGDFYNLGNPAPTYPSGASGIPSGWTEHTSL